MNKKKKVKSNFVKIRPFDKWLIEWSYFNKLSRQDKEWFLNYIKEVINGFIDKSDTSILSDRKILLNKYKQLTATPESKEEFYKRKKEKELKDGKKYNYLEFTKIEFQREFNRDVARRRNDHYATLPANVQQHSEDTFFNLLKLNKIPKEEDKKQEHYIEENIVLAQGGKTEDEEDYDFALKCLKANRLDYLINIKLSEIIDYEKQSNKQFLKLEQDLKDKNEEYEKNLFNKTNYIMFLYSIFTMCKHFSLAQDSLKIVEQLDQVFNIFIFKSKINKK